MIQPAEFNLRPYTRSDAQAVVEVVNAAAQNLGIQRAIVDNVGNVRLTRYVPLTSLKVVVTNPQNEVVGFAYLANKEQHIIYEVGGAVHPAYWQHGIGTTLLIWAEHRARALSAFAPAGLKTVLQTNLFEAEPEAIQLFTDVGYTKVREWLHLIIELNTPPVLPTLPDNLYLRQMDLDNDWDIVGPAMDEAFADHWGAISWAAPESPPSEETTPAAPTTMDENILSLRASASPRELFSEEEEPIADEPEDETYSNTPGFCFLVMDDNIAAGGILCNAKLVERSHTAHETGRVGSLFVRPGYRRRGIGRTLMLAAFQVFWQNGIRRIINDTDAENFTDAPRFYTNLGMEWYRREFLFEKEIRPGKEVRRLAV